MPRAEVGTPKYLANAMKSKGLQRLRWYCQVCEKQCRDDNGFKCHIATESHLRQMLVVGESAGKHISDFSMQFQAEFVSLLSRRFGTNRVKANNVYQEYIADKHHLHMNSTRWVSLSEFIKHLGRSGVVRVDETEKGFFISWIDNSPKALAKAEANQKKERAVTSDEQRERLLIAEQIERAKATSGEASGSGSRSASPEPSAPVGLQRDENAGPLRLSFGVKKSTSPPAPAEDASSTSPPTSTSDSPANTSASVTSSASSIPTASVPTPQPALKFNAFKKSSSSAAAVPAKTAPLKMNVFKAAKTSSTGTSTSGSSVVGDKRPRDDMPAAQRLILEDQERKRRRVGAV